MKEKKKSIKGGPYSCEELSEIVHAGGVPDYERFIGFLILVTAFVGELEGRLNEEPIQNWIEDEKAKIRSLLYKSSHQDCFRYFKPCALMLATQCQEAVAHLKSTKSEKEAVEYAINTLEQINDVILPKGEGKNA